MAERYKVKIARTAEADVEDVWSYIAADSPARAEGFVLRLEEQIHSLERSPLRCPLIPENEVLGTRYRHLIFGNYRTIFRVSGTAVLILRVIHGGRLLDASLLEGGNP